jgi:uncharacterized membrane protein YhaH (DUF805 family)
LTVQYEIDRASFWRATGCSLGLGVVLATLAVHIVVSVVAPGDAGTLHALFNPLFPILILIFVGIAGVVVFPVAALLTWPWRNAILNRPIFAAAISTPIGALVGYLASFGFAHHWYSSQLPGMVAGGVFGLVWVFVVRKNAVAQPNVDCFN